MCFVMHFFTERGVLVFVVVTVWSVLLETHVIVLIMIFMIAHHQNVFALLTGKRCTTVYCNLTLYVLVERHSMICVNVLMVS